MTLDNNRLSEICREIIKENLNIRWMCNSRVDSVTPGLLEEMKEAGCWLLSFGIESASQEILKKCKKEIALQQSRRAVEMARDVGIKTIGHFIFGLPGETKKTIERTIDFSLNLGLDFAEYYIATPFPGSKLFDINCAGAGTDWSKFEYSHAIFRRDLEKERKRAYFKFYFRIKTMINMVNIFGISKLPKLICYSLRVLLHLAR